MEYNNFKYDIYLSYNYIVFFNSMIKYTYIIRRNFLNCDHIKIVMF